MSVSGKISEILRLLTLVIGLLSMSISVFEYRIEDRIEHELEANKHQESSGDESKTSDDRQLYLPDYQATITSYQLHLVKIPNLLGHIPVLVSVTKWFPDKHPLTELNFFRTLFQHIISTNAP